MFLDRVEVSYPAFADYAVPSAQSDAPAAGRPPSFMQRRCASSTVALGDRRSLARRGRVDRLLELLRPVEDLYPAHVLETIGAFDFPAWPAAEQTAVRWYLDALDDTLDALPGLGDEPARVESRRARAALDEATPPCVTITVSSSESRSRR